MNSNRIATIVTAAVIGVSALALGGCDKLTEPFKDAPRSDVTNSQPADVIEMPDGFNNLASKCDHGNRLYVTYHGDGAYGSVSVVPHDPTCK